MDASPADDPLTSPHQYEAIARDAPRLASLLRDMSSGLDLVAGKARALAQMVRDGHYPTANGISYLDAKHLLLLDYCRSLVYYLLRKAEGLPIAGHPVVRSLVEIRLFLEKIRPIDKKMEYQIQKLTRAGDAGPREAMADAAAEDPLKFKPNPDMLVGKADAAGPHEDGGVYRPTRFAPTTMEGDRMSREEKQALRKEKLVLRQAKQSTFLKELLDEVEGRPEEIRDAFGSETKELKRYKAGLERRSRQEEELFTRAPVTKREKKLEKRLLKSRYGLQGLMDDFDDEIGTLAAGNKKDETPNNFGPSIRKKSNAHKVHKRRKR